jgi:hypothetical protein
MTVDRKILGRETLSRMRLNRMALSINMSSGEEMI